MVDSTTHYFMSVTSFSIFLFVSPNLFSGTIDLCVRVCMCMCVHRRVCLFILKSSKLWHEILAWRSKYTHTQWARVCVMCQCICVYRLVQGQHLNTGCLPTAVLSNHWNLSECRCASYAMDPALRGWLASRGSDWGTTGCISRENTDRIMSNQNYTSGTSSSIRSDQSWSCLSWCITIFL